MYYIDICRYFKVAIVPVAWFMKFYQHNFSYRIHPSTTKPTEYEAGRVVNVYRKNRGNSSLCSHSKHTRVPTDYSPKIYSTKFASDLISLLEIRINEL